MLSSITLGYVRTSGRRLTRAMFAEPSSSSTYMSLVPIYGLRYLASTRKAKGEDDYSDILTGVTDADEVYAEQCEAAAPTKRLIRFESFDHVAKETGGLSSTTKIHTRSNVTSEPILEDEQLVCTSFWGASGDVELVFDAETPFASDEVLALRSIFAPGSVPRSATRLAARSHEKPPPTPNLLDTSQLNIRPALSVHDCYDHESEVLDSDVSPVIGEDQDAASDSTLRRRGRSLSYSNSQIEHDPVLRYATGRTVLPGLDHLSSVTARSATIQYDRDIQELFYATTSFLDDCHDGECTCLDGKMHSLRVPGENFLLADNDGGFDFLVERPTSEDIFGLIDEVVHGDMFDLDADDRDISETVQLHLDVFSETSVQSPKPSIVLDQLLYISALEDVSPSVGDRDGVSDVSDTDSESLPSAQHPELTYVDTDTQQCIAYTALQQLFTMEEDESRPASHRDIPDEHDEPEIGLAELVYLYPINEGHKTLLLPSNSRNLNRFSFDLISGIFQSSAQLQPDIDLQPTVRRRCVPCGLYSSNRSHHQRRLPQLRLATKLLPGRKPLPTIEEEERSCSSSSSSAKSRDFADHRGLVKPLEHRRLGFLDDEDEGEDGSGLSVMPVTPASITDCTYEDLFTDAIWNTTPDLTLAQPSVELYVVIAPGSGLPPSPLLEAFEIEIHSRLTFMFDRMNRGRSNKELQTLSNDLHWTLCALANDYPALALLGSLGAAIEILVERMVASSFAS